MKMRKLTVFKVFNRFSPAKSIHQLYLEQEGEFFLLKRGAGGYIDVQENISALRRLYLRSKNYINAQENISKFSN
ncbi:hypothetical protein D9754_10185 [Planomicrobium sp. Y74]|nr:hypothetical protein D9754_10185 [Planomicrobium sp. Y74]